MIHYLTEESNALTMVDIMAGSLDKYDFSGNLEMECKDIAEKHLGEEVEDGELPEEGEICDDDFEGRESEFVRSDEVLASASSSHSSQRKSRDFDKEEVVIVGNTESIINSWMTGLKQRTKSGTTGSPTIDANEEYYGYGNSSPRDGSGDKDYRNRVDDAADKDYRWLRDEDGARTVGDINEFGDSDYRGGSPKLDRRRRRSGSPAYSGPKRPRHSPPMRGGYRGRGFRGRWGDRQICKFFREGYCRDGDNCSYSHDAADSGRKAELCKFYQQGFCKKGLQCSLLHGEYPCKAFHKGECSKDPCQFSHLPLNSFTQPIFDQMIKDDELASRIAIPQGPLKRRVLLPGGPSSSPSTPSIVPVLVTVTADGGLTGNVIPPPSVVVPTLSSTATPVSIAQPQLVIPSNLTASQTPYPAFFPHHSIPAPAVVNSSLNTTVPGLAPQSVQNTSSVLQKYTAAVDKRNLPEDEEDSSFNISKMLEQITAKVKKDNFVDDSPASPPTFNPDSIASESAPTIPEANVLIWKLHSIDDIPSPQTNIDSKILQMSLTDSALRNDPRIKKALASQFDAFTNSLMNAAPPPLPQPAQVVTQQSISTTTTVASVASAASIDFPREDSTFSILSETVFTLWSLKKLHYSSSKLTDPRMSIVNRDPRKRLVAGDPRVATISDSRLVSTTASADPRLGTLNNMAVGQVPSASTPRAGVDNLFATVSLTSRDQDHRLQSSYEINQAEEHAIERSIGYDGHRSSGSSWMPQVRATIDPRQVKRYGMSGYRNELNSSQDRDERMLSRARVDDTKLSPNNLLTTSVTTPQAPLSLREKRKNNEYESPLSRIPEKSRWT
ncbi:unnamed protein product [Thelazia callipaeda]|uniref:Zinc finger CCCH domain-containing protein 6 n=1 Tax=Thelazia callipaeda TaxID=103827 RepID=A0A0N5CM20_THECL|nr:unnamed protein product [Thelazia callipaeda]